MRTAVAHAGPAGMTVPQVGLGIGGDGEAAEAPAAEIVDLAQGGGAHKWGSLRGVT